MVGQRRTSQTLSVKDLRSLSDDDLLLLAISHVKATYGDVPDFTRTVAVAFEALKYERRMQSRLTS